MLLCVIGNFDVNVQSGNFTFPTAGTWYDYLGGGTFTSTGAAQSFNLQPGELHVFVNRNLTNAVVTADSIVNPVASRFAALVFPNPGTAGSQLEVEVPQTGLVQATLSDISGRSMGTVLSQTLTKGKHRIAIGEKIGMLPAGMYILSIRTGTKTIQLKLAIQ